MTMTADPRHPADLLHDAVDGRLGDADRAVLEQHLAGCERCRQELAALRLVKAQLAQAGALDVHTGLEQRLRDALDREDERRHAPSSVPRMSAWPRAAWWLSAAAALLVIVWFLASPRTPPVAQQVANDLRAFAGGSFPLAMSTADPAALERSLQADPAVSFDVRVFDFGMMNYRLAGGGVHRVAGRRTALFAYRDAAGGALLCQMYEGSINTLPAPDERRINDGIEFLVFRQDEVTVVVWQEGSVVCLLASNDDAETTIELAFAKAVRVTP